MVDRWIPGFFTWPVGFLNECVGGVVIVKGISEGLLDVEG